MAQFYPLTVSHIEKTTRDAVVITLVPDDPDTFTFQPGQYLTFRRDLDGVELRRSYSICSSPGDGTLKVGVKQVQGGTFSTWINTGLKVGDTIKAMPPTGGFYGAPPQGHVLLFAAGSGITPILSILKHGLESDQATHFTLIYANRRVSSIMFKEQIEDLKNQHIGRLSVLHILKIDGQDIDLFSGRLDAQKLADLFSAWVDPKHANRAYICGPEGLMQTISSALQDHGVNKNDIRFELFGAAQEGRVKQKVPPKKDQSKGAIAATIILDGSRRQIEMAADQSVLDAALQNSIDAPFSCTAGVCSTCRAKVIEGEVEMIANHALEDYEVKQGYVLTCQCYPLGTTLTLDYDL